MSPVTCSLKKRATRTQFRTEKKKKGNTYAPTSPRRLSPKARLHEAILLLPSNPDRAVAFPSISSIHRIPSDRIRFLPIPIAPHMADGDAPPSAFASAAAASPRSPAPPETPSTQKRRQRGLVSRVWKGIFGGREDVEKLLQALSKEEEAVRSRVHRRARASRQSAHNVLALAAALEIVAVGYAIMTTRSPDLSWQMRATRVMPMFLIPVLAALIYSTITSLTKMLDNRDQHTLEKLRAERQAKIDELKERTNYYTTQQLIQRYDLDPAAKAAAATVLASKLGADSGLRVFLGDESNRDTTLSKSNDAQLGQTTGLRQRKPAHLSNGTGRIHASESLDDPNAYDGNEGLTTPNQRTVEHFRGPAGNDGGWIARVAALLVGEDPTQCYALICGNCHMHNGLARKEDFAFITYYCPHCNALNGSRQHEDHEMVSNSGKETPISHSDGSIAHAGASLASSDVGSPVASSLPTVEELPAESLVVSNLPTVEEQPAESPVASNLPTVEEQPAESPVVSNLPTVEEQPAESPVASNLPTVEERPAESPVASNLPTVEELPPESPVASNIPTVEELSAEDTAEKASSDQPAS